MHTTPSIGVVRHGGRLRETAAAFPHAPRPWLDLSTGVNPTAWRGDRADWERLTRLPDPTDTLELEQTAGLAFGVRASHRVLATAGADQALRLLPAVLAKADVAIASPTYSGHAEAWRAGGGRVEEVDVQAIEACDAPVLVVVNPNNPDGSVIGRGRLARLAEARSVAGLWTIVDESFVEVLPDISVADLEASRLIVLRSFGKFYGLPGVRLGFAIINAEHAWRIEALRGDWPVSADAVDLGRKAYQDAAWRSAMRERLAVSASRLDGLLQECRLDVVGQVSLFRLAITPRAPSIFQALCAHGVLTRPFANRSDHLRFGLPGEQDFERLALALREATR